MLSINFSRQHLKYFSHFFQKIGFDISCQNLLSGAKKENIDLKSAEFAHSGRS